MENADVSRIATYSDVPAGTYTFKVKAFLLESPDKYDIKTITVMVPPYLLASTMALWIYLTFHPRNHRSSYITRNA